MPVMHRNANLLAGEESPIPAFAHIPDMRLRVFAKHSMKRGRKSLRRVPAGENMRIFLCPLNMTKA